MGNLNEQQEFVAPLSELLVEDCIDMFQSCYPDRPASHMQIRLVSTKNINDSLLDGDSEVDRDTATTCCRPQTNGFALLMRNSTERIHLPKGKSGRRSEQRVYEEVVSYLGERGAFCYRSEVELNGIGVRAARKLEKCMSLLTFFNTQLYPKTWNLRSDFKPPPVFKRFMNMNRECDEKYAREFLPSGDEGNEEMIYPESCSSESDSYVAPPVSKLISKKRRRRLTKDVCQELISLGRAFLREADLLLSRDGGKNGDWKKVGEEVSSLVLALETRINHIKRKEESDGIPCDEPEIRTHKGSNWFAIRPVLLYQRRPCITSLNAKLLRTKEWDVITVDDYVDEANTHSPRSQGSRWFRNRYVQDIKEGALSCPVILHQQQFGGSIGNVHNIIKIPFDYFENAPLHTNKVLTVVEKLLESSPIRLCRKYRESLRKCFGQILPGVRDNVIELLIRIMKDDVGAFHHQNTAEAMERFLLALETDCEFIDDLRVLNSGRTREAQKRYWEIWREEINKMNLAVQERRQDETMYLPDIISLNRAHEDIKKKVQEEHGEDYHDRMVPSLSWVYLQFQPKDTRGDRALKYTGALDLCWAIQTRTVRYPHPDAHYGNALLKYVRNHASKYHNQFISVSADEKARIQVGPPGAPLQTIARNRKSVVPTSHGQSSLQAGDHDFGGTTLTPSVYLIETDPERFKESWHSGSLHVSLKDSVFSRSHPKRHLAELLTCVKQYFAYNGEKCALTLVSDGGPDRNLTFASVQATLMAVFLELDLDQLIVVRTIPRHSYVNPVERSMARLNYPLQNVALSRDPLRSPNKEEIFKSKCNCMNDIRSLGEVDLQLKEEFIESMEKCREVVTKRFEAGVDGLQIFDPATEYEMMKSLEILKRLDERFAEFIKNVEYGLKTTTWKQWDLVQTFFQHHIHVSTYSFQIKKTKNCKCILCTGDSPIIKKSRSDVELPWLPMPTKSIESRDEDFHYKPWDSIEQTFEEKPGDGDEPSKLTRKKRGRKPGSKNARKQQRQLKPQAAKAFSYTNMWHESKVRCFVQCSQCNKMRCAYSRYQQTYEEEIWLKRHLEHAYYVCGGDILEGHHGTVGSTGEATHMYMDQRIHCQSPMEKQFYKSSAPLFGHVNQEVNTESVCFYCGLECDQMRPPGGHLTAKYTIIYPLCSECSNKGKSHQHGKARTAAQTKKRSRECSERVPEGEPPISEDSTFDDDSFDESIDQEH